MLYSKVCCQILMSLLFKYEINQAQSAYIFNLFSFYQCCLCFSFRHVTLFMSHVDVDISAIHIFVDIIMSLRVQIFKLFKFFFSLGCKYKLFVGTYS